MYVVIADHSGRELHDTGAPSSDLESLQESQLVHVVLYAAYAGLQNGCGAVNLVDEDSVQLSSSPRQALTQLCQQSCGRRQQCSLQLVCIHSEHPHITLHDTTHISGIDCKDWFHVWTEHIA